MRIDQLPAITTRPKKRLGRGYGSGKGGHTVGRGQKGQKVRDRIHPLFEGTKIKKSLIQRLPLQRGKGKFKSHKDKPFVVNLKFLELLPTGTEVDLEALIKAGIVNKEDTKKGVKILGEGEITKKLIVKLPASGGARKKIEKAGGRLQTNI